MQSPEPCRLSHAARALPSEAGILECYVLGEDLLTNDCGLGIGAHLPPYPTDTCSPKHDAHARKHTSDELVAERTNLPGRWEPSALILPSPHASPSLTTP